jgi:hypothetical protein
MVSPDFSKLHPRRLVGRVEDKRSVTCEGAKKGSRFHKIVTPDLCAYDLCATLSIEDAFAFQMRLIVVPFKILLKGETLCAGHFGNRGK